jgi:type VI secretion system protein ImpK
MHPDTARTVYPVLARGLAVKRRLAAGPPPAFDPEHAALKELLAAAAGGDGRFLGVRYPLACWLDELFTGTPAWAARWTERKLEGELYGTNDRAWKFWEQARLAEQMPADDALAVFHLCVRLGFRGELREAPDRLAEWVAAATNRLARLPPLETPYDLEPDPAPAAPPRRAGRRFERMLAACGAGLLVLVPAAGFLLAFRAGR